MDVTLNISRDYENKRDWALGESKPNQTQFKAKQTQFKPKQSQSQKPTPLDAIPSTHDAMRQAGHADLATTHKFYLATADDLLDRAREVTSGRKLAQMWHKCISDVTKQKSCQAQVFDSQELK